MTDFEQDLYMLKSPIQLQVLAFQLYLDAQQTTNKLSALRKKAEAGFALC